MKKKIFAALASVMMLGTALAAPVSAAENYQKGDVNMDGKVDIEDAQLVCEAYVIYMGGGDCILSEEQIVLASITNTTTSHYIDKETVPFSIADALILSYYYCFKNVSMIIDDSVSVDDFYNDLEMYIGMYLERGD